MLSLTACTTDNQDQSQAAELVSVNNITQSNIVTTLSEIAQSNNTTDFTAYDMVMDKKGNISVTNPRTLERNRFSEAYWSVIKQTNSLTIKLDGDTRNPSGIMVCCTPDGETYQCVTCPSGHG